MQTFIVRREIASRGRREASLAIDLNASAETVAIAALSAQRNRQPVKLPAAIEIKLRGFAKRGGGEEEARFGASSPKTIGRRPKLCGGPAGRRP